MTDLNALADRLIKKVTLDLSDMDAVTFYLDEQSILNHEVAAALRAAALLAAPSSDVREALEECKSWHERQDKALSKSGRADADYYWRRDQHRSEIDRIDAALSAQSPDAGQALPDDVVRLIIAARIVAFEDRGREAIKELDEASEAFADRVPWDDEPENENVDLEPDDSGTDTSDIDIWRDISTVASKPLIAAPQPRPVAGREEIARKIAEHVYGMVESYDAPTENGTRALCLGCADAILTLLQGAGAGEQPIDPLKIIEDACWDIRCINVPTGGDDYDVGWQIVEHHMAKPQERIIGYGNSPMEALRDAMTAPQQQGEKESEGGVGAAQPKINVLKSKPGQIFVEPSDPSPQQEVTEKDIENWLFDSVSVISREDAKRCSRALLDKHQIRRK